MARNIEDYIIEIARQASSGLGGTLNLSSLCQIGGARGKGWVTDAGLAFYIDGHRRADDAVLLVASPSFGHTVATNVAAARRAAGQVDEAVGRHIARPIYEGQRGAQSFAVFSRLSPVSDTKIIRYLQRSGVTARVTPWLIQLAQQTRRMAQDAADYDRLFIAPLIGLSDDADVAQPIRDFAKSLAAQVQKDRPDLFTVMQHDDFWVGNIMFERRRYEALNPALGDFAVIDWRGVRLDGYPGLDLSRYCRSIYSPGDARTRAIMRDYGAALGVSSREMSLYLMLALGRLGAELDQFPKQRYASMCDKVFRLLQTHILDS